MTLHIHLTTEPDPELQAALRRIEDALQAAKHKDETNMSQITDWAAEQQADLTAIFEHPRYCRRGHRGIG